MNVRKEEVAALRELAKRYMEVASLPIQREKMELWKKFNRNDRSRPMVTINQLPWHELAVEQDFQRCGVQGFLGDIESNMISALYKWKHFPVDMVVEPYLNIGYSVTNSGYGIEAQEHTLSNDTKNNIVSHQFINQFETMDDVEKIKDIKITLDEESSKERMEIAHEIFDGIIPVYQSGGTHIRLAIWDILAECMNVESIYYTLLDEPELIHAIMERMTHSALSGIEQCNNLGLFNTSSNDCHCSITYTDELLPDFLGGIGADSYHSWSCSMAQVFTSASPSITKEFEIDYMSKISEKFGKFYYGCCERLDDRLDIIEQLPNLTKVSCSPWSNRDAFAEKLSKHLIMSAKPSPSLIISPDFDEASIRADLIKTCEAAKRNDRNVELLFKDVSTILYQPERLTKWANIAMEVAEQYGV
ncbi:MAG: hypothetical protein R3Y47_01450 [Lachnospiraceae bacterium]